MKQRSVLKVLWIASAVAGGLAFFWLVVLKVLVRLNQGRGAPCPASLAWLVNNPIRRRYMRPVLDRADIRPGERVLELGPGPGAFTVEAAHRVGTEGRLIAVDIQPQMIAQVEQRVREAGLTNVEAHVADAYHLPLDDGSVDRAFLVTVLPEIPDQARALAELHRVIKPGGLLSITEEFFDPDYPFAFETVRRVEAAGFSLEQRFGNFWRYTVNFRKNADVAQQRKPTSARHLTGAGHLQSGFGTGSGTANSCRTVSSGSQRYVFNREQVLSLTNASWVCDNSAGCGNRW